MADVEPAGGCSESKENTVVLNERKLTELAAKEVASSSTAEEVPTEKPTATTEGKEDDHVVDIARRYVGDVAEMEGIEGFGQGYIDGINSYFLKFISPEAPRGSSTSRFFEVPKEIRNRAGSEDLYSPTFVNLSALRDLLLEMNINNGTGDHQLSHYFSHLYSILDRVEPDNSLKDVMKKIYEKKDALARCYDIVAEEHGISISIDFPHILALLLGGCFIFDTIFRWNPFRVYKECCHLWASELWVDLLLLGNQIPFFILKIFYGMFYDPSRYSTEKLVFGFFKDFLPLNEPAFLRREANEPNTVHRHVLHFVYDALLPDLNSSSTPVTWWSWFRRERPSYRNWPLGMRAIPTATRLQQVGVQFRPVKEKGLVLDFKRGVLRLPLLHVRKNTKKVLMNLLLWEQFCSKQDAAACINNYTILMDYLINTSKDVEILINSGVLEHSLATEEEVAQVFDTLGEGLGYTKRGEMYEANDFILKLSNELNDFCENKYNIWRAKLLNDYFGSPWSIISLVAAVFLLLFTLVQTFFSVFSYVLPPK